MSVDDDDAKTIYIEEQFDFDEVEEELRLLNACEKRNYFEIEVSSLCACVHVAA